MDMPFNRERKNMAYVSQGRKPEVNILHAWTELSPIFPAIFIILQKFIFKHQ